jgi:hypothetical protein
MTVDPKDIAAITPAHTPTKWERRAGSAAVVSTMALAIVLFVKGFLVNTFMKPDAVGTYFDQTTGGPETAYAPQHAFLNYVDVVGYALLFATLAFALAWMAAYFCGARAANNTTTD